MNFSRFTPRGSMPQIFWIAVGLAFLCFLPFWAADLPFWGSPIRTYQFSQVLLFATALLGLTILTGRSGLVSIGHGAFVAIGAYVAAMSMEHWDLPYGLAIPFAGAVGLLMGGIFGLPALRLSSHALTVVSISVALSLAPVLKYKHFDDWTGGSTGIIVDPMTAPFNLPLTDDQWKYFLALMVFVGCLVLVWSLLTGRLGRAWTASRDHEIAAASMGVNLAVYRVVAFALSGLFAGLAGGLYALIVQFISPESFTVQLSILLLTGLAVGGRDTIIGVIPGAFFIQFVPIWSDDISRALPLDRDIPPGVIYGLVLIAVMFVLPDGVMGLIKRGWYMLTSTYQQVGRRRQVLPPRADTEKLAESPE